MGNIRDSLVESWFKCKRDISSSKPNTYHAQERDVYYSGSFSRLYIMYNNTDLYDSIRTIISKSI